MVQADVLASIAGFASLPIAIVVVEIEGTIYAVNEAAERLLGRPADQIVGRKAWEVAPGMEHVWGELIAHARAHGSYRGEITAATPNQHRHISYVACVREHAGRSYVVGVAVD